MIGSKFGWLRGKLSAAPNTSSKASSGDKSQAVPAAGQPATKSDKAPAEVAPTHRS